MVGSASAQDWNGEYKILPADGPGVALDVQGGSVREGTAVTLGGLSPAGTQNWVITPKANGLYTIRPSADQNLSLAADSDGKTNGTLVVLARKTDAPAQTWTIRRNGNGSVSFLPAHAPETALDDYRGDKTPGARVDLWKDNAEDHHLQWVLKSPASAQSPPPATPGTAAASPTPHAPATGTLKEFDYNDSAIFPGTRRHCAVFVPEQYDGSKPACVYVQQDGYNKPQCDVLASLIAAKEMPVTIGVFIRPGVLTPPEGRDMGPRRNRSFEYDGLGDNYVRFLAEEILPYVAKTYGLKLSDKAADRCIVGASSGGIAAFNAAWERPDLFSRVYSASGSFVAFRGGNRFPTLVRQFEPKPIRVYLTAATDDMTNAAGDWFLINQEMDKALKFSGYDYSFHAVEGKHGAGYREQFADAMRFLWKDWPQPVPEGTGAPRVRDIINPDDPWTVALEGSHQLRSPACNSKGEVYFIDATDDKLCRLEPGGKTAVVADGAHADGLAVGPHDELYTVSSRTGNVLCHDTGGTARVYATGIPADHVAALPTKGLYMTGGEARPGEGSRVWFVEDATKTVVDTGLKSAAGLALRPDRWLLAVADARSKWAYSYEITPATGALTNKERFFYFHVADSDDDAGAESVCYAREGQMLAATRAGVQSFTDDGNAQVILPVPDRRRVTGVCLGGPGMNTLYAFCGDKIWKRVVKIHADGASVPSTNVKGSPL